MKEQELQTQRYIKEMEINSKERKMERMARERKMDMQILNADTSTMSEKRQALHEIAYEPVYNANIFRRRFRMRSHVFLRIVDALSNVYPYFQQRVDAPERRGLSPLQKCTAAIRMLAYGVAAYAIDDYVCISKSTTIECLKKFVESFILVFEDEYL
ncbi:uncharacterized protein LOC107493531 [Arachis duranensis]|uniref:Uncharacterized protein LOC107493531 n=1 Tax=Arachis duranensis TaxID=130453 RepID=A0A6P5MEP4_ARADU|nr:uncharacterized protein LOC107493531 [Arachis duranensis]